MRDFEIAVLILVTWVLLYHDSYSRASDRQEVTSVDEKWKIPFKIKQLDWEEIEIQDDRYKYFSYVYGNFQRHEFRVRIGHSSHGGSYDNEFTFYKRDRYFKIEDSYGHKLTLELEGYDYVILRWDELPGKKHYFRVI